jgi:hypothetical protein
MAYSQLNEAQKYHHEKTNLYAIFTDFILIAGRRSLAGVEASTYISRSISFDF